jgi:hypothetical protein
MSPVNVTWHNPRHATVVDEAGRTWHLQPDYETGGFHATSSGANEAIGSTPEQVLRALLGDEAERWVAS